LWRRRHSLLHLLQTDEPLIRHHVSAFCAAHDVLDQLTLQLEDKR
jgi:hypothetical protein